MVPGIGGVVSAGAYTVSSNCVIAGQVKPMNNRKNNNRACQSIVLVLHGCMQEIYHLCSSVGEI